jgi:ribonuclease P/MRP protein subunit POP5
MVRIKHRYLLVNILYPEQEARKTKQSGSGSKDDLPYTVQFRRPGPEQLSGKLLSRLIREGVSDLFGDYGSGMVSGSLVGKKFTLLCQSYWNHPLIHVTVKYCSQATSTAIIRVARAHYRMVWAALTFTTCLPLKSADLPCVMQVVRVSGTIRKAEEEAIRRARLQIRLAQQSNGGDASAAVKEVDHAVDNEGDLTMLNGIEDFGDGEEESDG